MSLLDDFTKFLNFNFLSFAQGPFSNYPIVESSSIINQNVVKIKDKFSIHAFMNDCRYTKLRNIKLINSKSAKKCYVTIVIVINA